MLCSPDSAAPIDFHYHGDLTVNSNPASHQRSCQADSSDLVSFSWSDFPVLGPTSSQDVPALVEIEGIWIGSEDSDSTATYSSDDSISRHSALEEEDVEVATTPKSKDTRKEVRFSNVLRIRTLEVTLGDHPCCVGGMALTCDWTTADQDECIDLDVYERYAPKRSIRELRLSYHERRCRLQASTGLSPAQLLQLEYAMVCAEAEQQPLHLLRPSASVSSLHQLSADI